jgi:hypothetical protein
MAEEPPRLFEPPRFPWYVWLAMAAPVSFIALIVWLVWELSHSGPFA